MSSYESIPLALKRLASKTQAEQAKKFFKTGEGEYSGHDKFIGIAVPVLRTLAKNYIDLSLEVLKSSLHSPINEERLLSLIILVNQYRRASGAEKRAIYLFYMKHKKFVNNWNLVDSSAAPIVGAHLFDASRAPLDKLADSSSLWDRRIAIVSTHYFIKQDDLRYSLKLSKKLLGDTEDLMHKAVGWTLREVGKRDEFLLKEFLDKNVSEMPRVCLRYAIEKFSDKERAYYRSLLIVILA